jgi:hypothetical protein
LFSGVPRSYFHLLNHVDAPDEEGTELPNLEAARSEALKRMPATPPKAHKDSKLGRRRESSRNRG